MTKQFAMIVGWVLILVGILNFFVESIELKPVHAIIHIVAGLLGVALTKAHKGYTMWVGIVGLILGVLGLITKEVLGIVDLPTWITIIHFVLGVAGILVWKSAKGGMKPAAPMAPTGGQV
jgi:hypothetical protein